MISANLIEASVAACQQMLSRLCMRPHSFLHQKGDRNMSGFRNSAGARFTVIAAILIAAQAFTLNAQEAAALNPPYAQFTNSTLTSSVNTIVASWVPVVTATKTTYQNVTIVFNVDASGNLTIAPGYPQIVPAPSVIVSNFESGNYVGPSSVLGGNALITVSGPGVTSGGATEWSLAASTGANVCTYPTSATWYVGTLTNNPLYSRIKAAGITSTAWSYGIIGSGACSIDGGNFNTDALIGLSQIGNTITIVSFTTNGKDQSTPADLIPYTLKQ
jgi:hypothetical protein